MVSAIHASSLDVLVASGAAKLTRQHSRIAGPNSDFYHFT